MFPTLQSDLRLINPITLNSLTHKNESVKRKSVVVCETMESLRCGFFPFKAQSVLTLAVSSYHKQTHIASLPDPLIATLLSCCLGYVRLHNTRSVWGIFYNLGVSPNWHQTLQVKQQTQTGLEKSKKTPAQKLLRQASLSSFVFSH